VIQGLFLFAGPGFFGDMGEIYPEEE